MKEYPLNFHEYRQTIKDDISANPQLEQMLLQSQKDYEAGRGMSTHELLKSISIEDFK